MIPHSLEFEKALQNPIKTLYVKIEIFDSQMNYITDIEKLVTQNDSGSISVDRSRSVRRNFNFSLLNYQNLLIWGENQIVWIDKRVRVLVGLKLADGTVEYVPQGVFILTEPQTSHTPQGTLTTLSGQDKSYLFVDRRGKLVNEQIIETGVNIATAIKIIASSEGESLFLFDNITETVPYELTYNSGENKWKLMEDLANLAKCQIYYDTNGYLVLRKIESLNELQNEAAVWTFTQGDMFYAGSTRKLDESNTFNHYVTIGGGTETEVVRDEIIITETNPLWTDSPFSIEKIGRCVYFHNEGNFDGLLTTVDECHWRNKFELMKRLGYSEKVELNIAPLFILDATDIIQIEDNVNGTTGRYMVDSFDIPLKPQLVTVSCSKEIRILNDWNAI